MSRNVFALGCWLCCHDGITGWKKDLTISDFCSSGFQTLGGTECQKMTLDSARFRNATVKACLWIENRSRTAHPFLRFLSLLMVRFHPVFVLIIYSTSVNGFVFIVTDCFSFFFYYQVSYLTLFLLCWDNNVKVLALLYGVSPRH